MDTVLTPFKVAILYPGTAEDRRAATPEKSRFLPIFDALTRLGAQAVPAVYDDHFADEVRTQLMGVDSVLVWVNPNEGGRDRVRLDTLLRDVAASGVFVSAHPDVIDVLGTKEILYRTRHMSWGLRDTQVHSSPEELRRALSAEVSAGRARVIKLIRGQSGNGVWKIERDSEMQATGDGAIRIHHAQRGSVVERSTVDAFADRFEPYFGSGGRIIDQAYQSRLPEGMVRCYLVHDQVAGFGQQAINALCPPAPGDAAPPATSPRLYYSPTLPQFQSIKRKMEREWLPELQRLLDLDRARLPIIWDCDFLLGEKDANGEDTHVLCEINTSCVAPFPDSAIELIAGAALERARESRQRRCGA